MSPGYHTQTDRKPVRQNVNSWWSGVKGVQTLLTIFLFKFEVISHKELGKELLVQTLNGLCSLLRVCAGCPVPGTTLEPVGYSAHSHRQGYFMCLLFSLFLWVSVVTSGLLKLVKDATLSFHPDALWRDPEGKGRGQLWVWTDSRFYHRLPSFPATCGFGQICFWMEGFTSTWRTVKELNENTCVREPGTGCIRVRCLRKRHLFSTFLQDASLGCWCDFRDTGDGRVSSLCPEGRAMLFKCG